MSKKNQKGFTIIEVVLVLAIAGLIFLMVFIALPNMQAAQRNTQRRNDYNSLSTQITNYATNHNGGYPATVMSTWFNSQGTDPDGEPYSTTSVVDKPATANTPGRNSNQAYVYKKAVCDTAGNPATGKNKEFVVWGYVEEGAGTAGTYCLSSHI